MPRFLSSGFAALSTLLKRSHARRDLLILAYAALYAPLFFSNEYGYAPKVFVLIFLPAALLVWSRLSYVLSWPTVRLSFKFSPVLAFSIIVAAAFLYLLSMNLSSWSQLGFDRRLMDRQWISAGQILLFMGLTALCVAQVSGFLTRLICVLAPLIAVSAFINIWQYMADLPAGMTLFDVRLINWLGMPGYTNSTNISLTYAVYFVAALAAILVDTTNRRLKLWLTPFAAILLAAMLLTQSRSAYIGAAIGVAALFFLNRDRAYWTRNGLKYAVAVLVVGVALSLVPQIQNVVTARGESLRPEIWKVFLGKAVAKPLLGYGGLSNIDIVVQGNITIDQPHNIILSSQIRGGIFCMLAMVTMLGASAWYGLRFWTLRRCAIPLAMIATIIPTAMFDYNLLITPATWPWVTFWFPFAVCAGAEIAVRTQSAGPP